MFLCYDREMQARKTSHCHLLALLNKDSDSGKEKSVRAVWKAGL